MPIYVQWHNANMNIQDMVLLAQNFKDAASQIQALNILHSQSEWSPLSLQAGGIVHIAFCGILGVGSWARSQQNIAAINSQSYLSTQSDSHNG
jgi:hypothetical protein